MRVLQVGGGSMGTRRMRDLQSRPDVELMLLDRREDRRDAARERFGVRGVASLEEALAFDPDAFVISTPPDLHAELVDVALDAGLHFFCEADIWPHDAARVEAISARTRLVAAPSATLLFQPLVREVARIVEDELGRVHSAGYVLSVDAPSWHPDEGPEYYARHRGTAPAREMVAFELIALQRLFGAPTEVSGRVIRRGKLALDSEDTFSLQYVTRTGAVVQLTVLMACPQTTRHGWVAGDHGIVRFDLLAGTVQRELPAIGTNDVRKISDWAGTLEAVYHEEITTFLDVIGGRAIWPYSYRDSSVVCGALAAAELSMLTGISQSVRSTLRPARVPDAYDLDAHSR
jgi:predicted dehydrogenase